MEITLTIPDDLAQEAKARGISVEAYVRSLIEKGQPSAGLSRQSFHEDGGLVKQFAELVSRWRRETRHVSSLNRIVAHPAYLQIVGMGRCAVPLLLEELKEQPDHWLVALNAITGEDPAPDGATFKEAVEAWIKWGVDQGLTATRS